MPPGKKPILITGGCGFIGSNLADSLLSSGEEVILLDNLSRRGVERNLTWLQERHGSRVHPVIADVRQAGCADDLARDAGAIFHLAAQTAVTTSMDAPLEDFEVNARGTLNILESVRRSRRQVPVVFSSTNKVYGNLADVELVSTEDRYAPSDESLRVRGIGEARPLDFCTPYGCSKGVADQYVLDYCHSFGIPSAVLRMSCIYGPRQFGTEDQGWVAHFLIRALEGRAITIFGDGRQVRDILHVRDAVAAYRAVLDRIGTAAGRAFNLGGGPANAVSLQMVLREMARILGRPAQIERSDWRPGDQLYFVADTRRLHEELGWQATISWREGLRDLAAWLRQERFGEDGLTAERLSA